ncbi:MAG: hypothetical protein JWM93_2470 [Frankiales bacterium]|nr:hypothetical protein [Frankiales bacterium]
MTQPTGTGTTLCPECRARKCGNCNGQTWDTQRDEPTACPCFAAGHAQVVQDVILGYPRDVCAYLDTWPVDVFEPTICGRPAAYVGRSVRCPPDDPESGMCVEHAAWMRANRPEAIAEMRTA